MDWGIRRATEADWAFVIDSWLNATRNEPWAGNVPNNMASAVLQESIKQLIARGMVVLVACNPGRESQIVGWAAVEAGREAEKIVHMVYVKQPFRRTGIAKYILDKVGLKPSDAFVYTYRTRMSKVFPNAKYIPGVQRRLKV